jgi:hypothetical protein
MSVCIVFDVYFFVTVQKNISQVVLPEFPLQSKFIITTSSAEGQQQHDDCYLPHGMSL